MDFLEAMTWAKVGSSFLLAIYFSVFLYLDVLFNNFTKEFKLFRAKNKTYKKNLTPKLKQLQRRILWVGILLMLLLSGLVYILFFNYENSMATVWSIVVGCSTGFTVFGAHGYITLVYTSKGSYYG